MYKVEAISVSILSAEEAKQRNLIDKLSSGFTKEHSLAREMDDLLSESVNRRTATNMPPKLMVEEPKLVANNNIKQVTEGLLRLIRDLQTDKPGPVQFNGKISYGQLDDDLQTQISAGGNMTVQYKPPLQPLGPKLPKSMIPEFQKVVDDLVLGQNVFLVGGAGTGKTTLAQNVAEALGRDYMTINCSQWTAPTEIIGGQTLDGYQEGKLIEAWDKGYILILDELPKIDPNTAGLFNDALAKTKTPDSLIFNSRKERFAKHPNFAVIATGNIWPNTESMAYGANNKQDLSLLDRFAGCVYKIEKNIVLEKSVIGSVTLWSWCDELRRCIELLKFEAQISMRFMLTCRDTLALEITRLNQSDLLASNQGKTLADCFIGFLTTNFTKVQQEAIKTQFKGLQLGWDGFFRDKLYRENPVRSLLVKELINSGYLINGATGLGYIAHPVNQTHWYE